MTHIAVNPANPIQNNCSYFAPRSFPNIRCNFTRLAESKIADYMNEPINIKILLNPFWIKTLLRRFLCTVLLIWALMVMFEHMYYTF